MKRFISTLIAAIILIVATSCPVSAQKVRLNVHEYGTCRITAYSGNNGSTFGASMETLIPNFSCAASRDIPFGTLLYVDGFGIVRVDDRFNEEYEREHDGMVIDLYLESYEAACEWGLKELTVYYIDKITKIE